MKSDDAPCLRYGQDTPGHRALRKGRFSETGRAYFITFTVNQRRPLLTGALAQYFIEHLLQWQRESGFALLAFVVMPDHVHLLGILTEQSRLSDVVRRLKGRTGRALNRLLGQSGPFWQSAFYDHALRVQESVEAVARYIEENPVRRGLVVDPSEYPFSSANAVYAEQMLGWQWWMRDDDLW
ncbi:REP-associated tyrosine transposase [Thermoflexus hugenholtzii]